MPCAICQKRPPKRFCPALGEKICPICCGKEREVTLNCPLDCSYLIAAHRYEAEHRQPLSRDEFPYREIEFPVEYVYEHWPVINTLASAILQFHLQYKELNDHSAYSALESLAVIARWAPASFTRSRQSNRSLTLFIPSSPSLSRISARKSNGLGLPRLSRTPTFSSSSFLCCASPSRRPMVALAQGLLSNSCGPAFLSRLRLCRRRLRASSCRSVFVFDAAIPLACRPFTASADAGGLPAMNAPKHASANNIVKSETVLSFTPRTGDPSAGPLLETSFGFGKVAMAAWACSGRFLRDAFFFCPALPRAIVLPSVRESQLQLR
jgi:hypothetical protein